MPVLAYIPEPETDTKKAFARNGSQKENHVSHFELGQAAKDWLDTVYYDRTRKEFMVPDETGEWFTLTETQFRRHCKIRGIATKTPEDSSVSPFDEVVYDLQQKRAVSYAGHLAGYNRGLRMVNGLRILVTSSPRRIVPEPGGFPVLRAFLEGLLGDPHYDQVSYFHGWAKCALEALEAQRPKPGQMLAVAGPAESGKSLLQTVITWLLGGREARPYAYMTGATDFNSELFGAEHLRLDDEQSHVDMRARRAFGSRVKELLFSHQQRMHRKHAEALTLDPLWRMSVTLNDEPEHLLVLPPIDESLEDKILLLRAYKRPMPMPSGTAEEARAFGDALRSELPAYVHWLFHEFELPAPLRNARCGVAHFHHPELLTGIRELSAHYRLLNLLDMELFSGACTEWEGTAEELEKALCAPGSSVASEARRLLAFNNACGTFLGRLAKDLPGRVRLQRSNARRMWVISGPVRG